MLTLWITSRWTFASGNSSWRIWKMISLVYNAWRYPINKYYYLQDIYIYILRTCAKTFIRGALRGCLQLISRLTLGIWKIITFVHDKEILHLGNIYVCIMQYYLGVSILTFLHFCMMVHHFAVLIYSILCWENISHRLPFMVYSFPRIPWG